MNTLLETDGKGDTIHPNALGHLHIARAVYRALGGSEADVIPPAAFKLEARTEWTQTGARSFITAKNSSKIRRHGVLAVQQPTDARLEAKPVPYDLKPGAQVQVEVGWQGVNTPQDLMTYPANRYLAQGMPVLPLVDFSGETSRVYAVTAPMEPMARLIRGRQIVTGNAVMVKSLVDGAVKEKTVTIPPDSQVGRVPLLEKFTVKKKDAHALGELVYVQYGAARSGEATVDGALDEWEDAKWVPVGLPVQARSWRGPEDNRAQQRDCDLSWAFKAGKDGMYLACRAVGDIKQDMFTLFFDPRAPELLGTAGRYYWVSGKLSTLGKVDVRKGETSKEAPGLKAVWQETPVGANVEFFVPYAALDLEAWPKAGDLGLSIVWTHNDALGKKTVLLWSENGHWWNPRWFGVVRKTDEKSPVLPFMVRVE